MLLSTAPLAVSLVPLALTQPMLLPSAGRVLTTLMPPLRARSPVCLVLLVRWPMPTPQAVRAKPTVLLVLSSM